MTPETLKRCAGTITPRPDTPADQRAITFDQLETLARIIQPFTAEQFAAAQRHANQEMRRAREARRLAREAMSSDNPIVLACPSPEEAERIIQDVSDILESVMGYADRQLVQIVCDEPSPPAVFIDESELGLDPAMLRDRCPDPSKPLTLEQIQTVMGEWEG